MQRENEKLKVEKKSNKINLGRYSINRGFERSGLEESMSFLNVSVTSSIRDNKEGRSFSRAKDINLNKDKDK